MTRDRDTGAITVDTLTPAQISDLRALAVNQRHPLAPNRRKLLHRLGLITPIEPPREPYDGHGKRKPRAHAVTEAGMKVLRRVCVGTIQWRDTNVQCKACGLSGQSCERTAAP